MAARLEGLYLGLDFSTQQLKPIVIDETLKIHEQYDKCAVVFDRDLNYSTTGGVVKDDDGRTVTAPTVMWIEALDCLLKNLKACQFPFSRVLAVSGSGQQHGSVYWSKGSEDILSSLDPATTLASQLKTVFSIPQSPVWMDSSTTEQCRHLENQCGGALEVAKKTGSRAYERFTGNQIAKLNIQNTGAMDETERISLVSSFGACLLTGSYAPIDYSDGSGMNLLDIQRKKWWNTALDLCCPNLADKLGEPVPSNTIIGAISDYYVTRYGFPRECKVVAFTGDNPSSLAGMRLQEGDVVVSLGSSDTVFLWIAEAQPQIMGHIFINPVDSAAYMALLCYKNGSFAREKVRDRCAGGKWEIFDDYLDATPPGNDGYIGFYYDDPEITPPVTGTHCYDPDDECLRSLPPEKEPRAIVESQFLAKYVHAHSLGYRITPTSRILATGGASENKRILQILANVFNASVYTGVANSASLGAAYRAKHALMPCGTPFSETVSAAPPYTLAVTPEPGLHNKVYLPMSKRVDSLLNQLPTFQ